jgi:hypothetical protein
MLLISSEWAREEKSGSDKGKRIMIWADNHTRTWGGGRKINEEGRRNKWTRMK